MTQRCKHKSEKEKVHHQGDQNCSGGLSGERLREYDLGLGQMELWYIWKEDQRCVWLCVTCLCVCCGYLPLG